MKRIKLALVLLLLCTTFCSCTSGIDLKSRAIVQAMGIDLKDGKYKIVLQEYSSVETDENKESIFVFSQGDTIFDAVKNAESKDGKQVFYGHSRLFVIGREAYESSMPKILEFMNSNYQISLNSSVVVAEKDAASLITAPDFGLVAPNVSLERIEQSGKSVDATVADVLKDSYNKSGCFCLPVVSHDENNEVKFEGCVAFKDNRSLFVLDLQETMGLNLISGNVSDGVFFSKQSENIISVNLTSDKTTVYVECNENGATFCVSVSSRGNISEMGAFENKKTRKKWINSLESDIEKQMSDCIVKAFKKIFVQNCCDVFYIKQRIKCKDKALYTKIDGLSNEKWMPSVKISVKTEFYIDNFGIQVK